MMEKIYVLFGNRHYTPVSEGVLFSDYAFRPKFRGVHSEHYQQALECPVVGIIVTGLSMALTEFLRDRLKANPNGGVYTYHYNKDTEAYERQWLHGQKCPNAPEFCKKVSPKQSKNGTRKI